MRRSGKLLVAAVLVQVAGCFQLKVGDRTVQCHDRSPRCPEGYFCGPDSYCYANGHTPPAPDLNPATKAAGDPCSVAGECLTGHCVDGVCCATECSDSCDACNVPGLEGTCSPLPSGQTPLPSHPACGPDPTSSCGRDGTCDGHGFCRKYDAQTVCKPSTCDVASNLFTADSLCDGKGNCVAPASITCAPFACKPDSSACYPGCTPTGGECSAGNVCESGSCGLKVDGSTCAADPECKSGHCIDRVCCATSCDGQCQACDLPSSRGSCATVTSGAPHVSHPACSGSDAICAGSCTGDPMACTYPGAATVCQPQGCASSVVSYAKTCNGAGACVAPTPATLTCQTPANGAATCNGSACGITCNAYYAPDASGKSCVPVWTSESASVFVGKPLVAVWGSGPNNVFAINSKNIFHSTGDGNWTNVFTVSGTFVSLRSIVGVDSDSKQIFAMGDYAVYHSSDGGITWPLEYSPGNGPLIAAAGGGSDAKHIVGVGAGVWSNIGGSWHSVTQSMSLNYQCVTAHTPWVVAAGGDIYSTVYDLVGPKEYSAGWTVNAIAEDGTGYYAVGAGGHIVYGVAASGQWGTPTQNSSTSNNLWSAYATTAGVYAVGENGTILYSTRNGTWSPQVSNTTAWLRAVWASGVDDVYVVGNDSGNGVVLHLR